MGLARGRRRGPALPGTGVRLSRGVAGPAAGDPQAGSGPGTAPRFLRAAGSRGRSRARPVGSSYGRPGRRRRGKAPPKNQRRAGAELRSRGRAGGRVGTLRRRPSPGRRYRAGPSPSAGGDRSGRDPDPAPRTLRPRPVTYPPSDVNARHLRGVLKAQERPRPSFTWRPAPLT